MYLANIIRVISYSTMPCEAREGKRKKIWLELTEKSEHFFYFSHVKNP